MLWSASHDTSAQFFDIDTVDNILYYFNGNERCMKRVPLGQIDQTPESIFSDPGLSVTSIAVDWIGR